MAFKTRRAACSAMSSHFVRFLADEPVIGESGMMKLHIGTSDPAARRRREVRQCYQMKFILSLSKKNNTF
jgi:hypothetical protein